MRYLTLEQTSKKLGDRSRSSLYRDFAAGRLPQPLKIGGRLYLCEEAIDKYLANTTDVRESGK